MLIPGTALEARLLPLKNAELLLVAFLAWLSFSALAWESNDCIAIYRLNNTSNDSLGKTEAFISSDTCFSNHVLFVDGNYNLIATPGLGVCWKTIYRGTPLLTNLNYEAFAFSLDFYPLSIRIPKRPLNGFERRLNSLTSGANALWFGKSETDRAIFIGGDSYRWIGFDQRGGALRLTLNNQRFIHRFPDAQVRPNRWHQLVCSVDLQGKRILTSLDGRQLESVELPMDFKLEVLGSTAESTDREFTFINYSSGSVFYGYASNLEIFSRALTESEIASLVQESASERPVFPKDSLGWERLLPIAGAILVVIFAAAIFLVRSRKAKL